MQDNIDVARSWADAPAIDGLVHVQNGEALNACDVVTISAVEATEHAPIGMLPE